MLDKLDLSVTEGEVVALMGKNGAGKSTLLRLLARIATPTAGTIDFRGRSITSDVAESRRGILYLGHAPGLYPALTALENLDILVRLHGTQADSATLHQALEKVGLGSQLDDPIKIYSQGMLQRLKLAAALCTAWDLLLFDEPLTGLDAAGRLLTEKYLRQWKSAGKTMLLVVHDFQWIWDICTRLIILSEAQVGADITLDSKTRRQAQTEFDRLVG